MVPWEPRRDQEPSLIYLARVLASIPVTSPVWEDFVARARRGHFDDYFCPPEVDDGMNMQRLVAELDRHVRATNSVCRRAIGQVRSAVIAGEFDGTKAESDAWAASAEGQEIFDDLVNGR